jgi:hypothetical protein
VPYADADRQRQAKRDSARKRRREKRTDAAIARAAASSTPDGPAGPGSPRSQGGTADGLPSLAAVAATAWAELQAILASEPADLSRARVVARLAEVSSSLVERANLEQRVTDLEASLADDARHLRAVR